MRSNYRALRSGGICILMEQLKSDPVSRWLRDHKFPWRKWHYFSKRDFVSATKPALMDDFEQVEVKCVTLLTHTLEQWFPHRSALVRIAAVMDRLIERLVPANWKHLVAVIAIKE